MTRIIQRHGIEGYGLYFACLEIIAEELSPENFNFELEHDAELLAVMFKIDTLKVERIMRDFLELGLFDISPESQRVACYKLAKRLDNATAQNVEVRKILSNFKLLKVSASNLKQIRLDEIRSEEKLPKPSCPAKAERKPAESYPIAEVIDYLNLKTGKSFKPTGKQTQSVIRARFNEGFSLEDFKAVIDKKAGAWLGDPKMEEYLRPQTLFNAAKFESYLNSEPKGGRHATKPGSDESPEYAPFWK